LATEGSCPKRDPEIVVPDGFCVTIFADQLGHARHLAVGPDGTVYVNTWSGSYYDNDRPPDGGFIVALKDRDGDGIADNVTRFGPGADQGGHGGTGIAFYNQKLFVEETDKIIRYEVQPDGALSNQSEVVLDGLPRGGAHPVHPFAINSKGQLFVAPGSATDACAKPGKHARGESPCQELTTRAGIWLYDANVLGQHFSPSERYATGCRNAEGLDFDSAGRLYATQHGRGHLHEAWPELYSEQQGFELPAEELTIIWRGASYGWPSCYFDAAQQKRVLAPEYGGDGKKVGTCAHEEPPVAVFPAHWAPNDMKIYGGSSFPGKYGGGAFIAFHGSFNPAGPHGGYNVVFQPLKDGTAAGSFQVFADGFAGGAKDPERAKHRPSGVAIGPDGSLYISDDKAGRVWRVSYEKHPR
jgi:glucose/arabinose dehydrogenase